MRKFFYLVNFSYMLSNGDKSFFDLGIFSSLRLARQKILESRTQEGFREYSIDNYEIIKFGVEFDNPVENKSNVILYTITHEYTDCSSGDSFWTVFDYCDSYKKAEEKIFFLKAHNRIGKKHPENFKIIANQVDNFNFWSEGFTSY